MNIDFLQADMYALPFAIETFDFIFFSIYPTAGKRRFEVLRQAREILHPGGIVMLLIPTPLYRRRNPSLPPDVVTLTDEEIAEEIVKIKEVGSVSMNLQWIP